MIDKLSLGLVRQVFPKSERPDIPATLRAEFERTGLLDKIKPSQRVVITSGSRGIESMNEVIVALVGMVKGQGALPLILPAMGSHGGGTPEGQIEILAHLGQTPESLGATIIDDYRPQVIGKAFGYLPLSVDANALGESCDHVILVGRVKEHTEFIGPIESGLLKMAVVGLGRREGAILMHQAAVRHTYYQTIMKMAEIIFAKAPILGGVALLEDHRNVLRRLEAVPVGEIAQREPALFRESQETKPKLPWDRLDILLVDELGKDISGSGLDTKVIGRIMNIYEREPEMPKITRVVTFRVSRKGGGNALGIGLNDYVTRELFESVVPSMTDLNSTVAVSPEKGRCPLIRENAREALQGALDTVGPYGPDTLEMAWIPNTKDLEYLAVTPALYEKAKGEQGLERLAEPAPIPFDGKNNLPPFASWLSGRGI
ncbi:MAG: hypothetical protein LBU69_03410 [Deltaproteobacteria bacterium]|jgi:hypothetical protein|nr:hypothetical protein [Deltaproteobacteria bacterium]